MKIVFLDLVTFVVLMLIIYIIDRKAYRKQPTKEEVKNYQKIVDEEDERLKDLVNWPKRNALRVIQENNAQKRGFVFIFFGIALACSILIIPFVNAVSIMEYITTFNIIVFTAIFCILYGLIEMTKDKRLALKIILLVLAFGVVFIILIASLLKIIL